LIASNLHGNYRQNNGLHRLQQSASTASISVFILAIPVPAALERKITVLQVVVL